MIYAPILSTAQKWFPGRTGFASGVVITANGILRPSDGTNQQNTFGSGGPQLAFLTVGLLIGSLFWNHVYQETRGNSRGKNAGILRETHQYTSAEMVKTRKFYYLLCTMMCGLMAYYLTSPLSQTLQTDRGLV